MKENRKQWQNLLYAIITISLCFSKVSCQNVIDLNANSNPDPAFLPDFPPFEQYILDFQKPYQRDSVEYLERKKIYESWTDYWMQKYHNGLLTYKVGATFRSDWTEQERQKTKILETEEPEGQEDHIVVARVGQSAGMPTSIDWRDKGVVTSVKDQGSCGSCWTFATAAYGESRMIRKFKKSKDIDLSEQFLLSCTPQSSCNGGYLEYVFEESQNGVPTEKQYSYNPYGYNSPFICWTESKERFGYIAEKAYNLNTLELEKLVNEEPIAISISATDWEDYKGGIFKCSPADKVNHAVLLVGYDQYSWIIKNQWGKKWGQNGYIRVTKDRLYNCKIGQSAFWMQQPYNTLISLLLFTVLTLFLI